MKKRCGREDGREKYELHGSSIECTLFSFSRISFSLYSILSSHRLVIQMLMMSDDENFKQEEEKIRSLDTH